MTYSWKQKSDIIWMYSDRNYKNFIGEDFSEYLKTAHYWVEVQKNGTPYTPCKEPMLYDFINPIKYFGDFFVGPFHCSDCALDCVSFGKTRHQAWEANHGNDDEKYFAFFGG